MSSVLTLINTPHKILWHNGAINNYLPFRPYDVRSTANGIEYWICEYNERHIEAVPADYPNHDICRCFFDTDLYKELVQNAETHNGEAWIPLDLPLVGTYNLKDTPQYPAEMLLNYYLPSYKIVMQSYFLDKQSLPVLESLQKEIEHLRSKIESGFSGFEYCTYPLDISTKNNE